MGLEDFKTEGPRTRTKNTGSESTPDEKHIHFPKGKDVPDTHLPDKFEVHRLVKSESTLVLELPDDPPYYVCGDCGRVSGDPLAAMKVDMVKHRGNSWTGKLFDELFSAVESMSESDWVEADTSSTSTSSSSSSTSTSTTTSNESESTPSSGLDSFMT